MMATRQVAFGASSNNEYGGLRVTAIKNNSYVELKTNRSSEPATFEYSLDGEDWNPLTIGSSSVSATRISLPSIGDVVYIRAGVNGNGALAATNVSYYVRLVGGGELAVGGNILSLINQDFDSVTLVPSYCFLSFFGPTSKVVDATELIIPDTDMEKYGYARLFMECSSLVYAPKKLPLPVNGSNAYYEAFKDCTSLVKAPELPDGTLHTGCYKSMFSGCTSLVEPPELPAVNLADECYYRMFYNCTSLAKTPSLPAETLTGSCYYEMFYGCTGLTEVSDIYATSFNNYSCWYMFYNCSSLVHVKSAINISAAAATCCYAMFRGCTSLVEAPTIIATAAAESCFDTMFYGCSSLKRAGQVRILAPTLYEDSCHSMFSGCSSLIEAPELSSMNLASYCYWAMFNNCTSLTQAPELPATTLANDCYTSMFKNCTSLKTAPLLRAVNDTDTSAMGEMFAGCSNLSYICTNQQSFVGCTGWVDGVSASGVLECSPILGTESIIERGIDACPEGWTVDNSKFKEDITIDNVGVYKFSMPTSNTARITQDVVADILVVGGGGAGACPGNLGINYGGAGGGGAGGMVEQFDVTLRSGIYEINVGAGGFNHIPTSGSRKEGADGEPSIIILNGTIISEALGGGGGGLLSDGHDGGSGGGGSSDYKSSTVVQHAGGIPLQPISNFAGYGYSGGAGKDKRAGGGGGGAGGAGSDSIVHEGATIASGGAGGAGRISNITGEELFYAAGGGGGSRAGTAPVIALGGSGIGGNGGHGSSTSATAGKNGTGSGGGGGRYNDPGGRGGSGVVIIRVKQLVR